MYPVRYEADFELEQSRWITFFRLILAVPWLILGSIYSIAVSVVALIAWFAILFTGRYPESLYDFNAGFLRYAGRTTAFTYLQTDRWPPFGFEEAPQYPVRIEIDRPLESYSRAKAFFRLILAIPVFFMLYLASFLYQAAGAIAWFHIVFTGRTSGGVHNALTTGLAYQERATAYLLLLTETFPPVSDQEPAGLISPSEAPTRQLRAAAPAPKPRSTPKRKAPAKRKPAAKRKAAAKKKPAAKRRPSR